MVYQDTTTKETKYMNKIHTMRICLISVSDARSVMLPTNTVVVWDIFPVELSDRG